MGMLSLKAGCRWNIPFDHLLKLKPRILAWHEAPPRLVKTSPPSSAAGKAQSSSKDLNASCGKVDMEFRLLWRQSTMSEFLTQNRRILIKVLPTWKNLSIYCFSGMYGWRQQFLIKTTGWDVHRRTFTREPKYPRRALRFGCTCQVWMPSSVGFIFLAFPILAPRWLFLVFFG